LPRDFISIAEESGLIVPLGEWILRTACAQTSHWRSAGHPQLQVAVNFSARQFQSPQLFELINQVLQETRLPPSALQIEITETTAMHNGVLSSHILPDLDELGVLVSIDDFGNGYSALGNLKRIPFKILKIDQSFIHNIENDPHNAAITRAIIAIAHALKLRVIAEGIETQAQVSFLHQQECEEFQGVLFSPAVPAYALGRLLQGKLALNEFIHVPD
jgi:EAL domain-containing protein (putative c-di-GMP-specific phosphodiesterase class I)